MKNEIVKTELGDNAYDILIGDGLLDHAGELIRPLLQREHIAIVTDENVWRAQGGRLESSLKKAGLEPSIITLPPGESTKSFNELEGLIGRLLDLGVERQDAIIAFGGGVVGDITGFAASILRRGCRFIQIPTTLLAQVDSSVGGKTAINATQGKNLVGAFHQPSLVLSDVSALASLPVRELRAGYAEVVKYGLIADLAFFEWLEVNGERVLSGEADALIEAVKTSCAAKAAIVAADEKERGERALLNLGHTFGHALEAAFHYSDKLLHGEAVAAGMALAFEYSVRLGKCAPADAARVKAHLARAGLPVSLEDLPASAALTADNLMTLMMQDKKVEQNALTLILANAIGDAHIMKNAHTNDVKEFLNEKLSAANVQ